MYNLKHLLLTTSLLLPTTLSAPVPDGTTASIPHALPSTQGCVAADGGTVVTYTVNVGRPFNQATCNRLSGGLHDNCQVNFDAGGGLLCTDDGQGNFELNFSCGANQADSVNSALAFEFHGIMGGFNCPGH